MKIDQHIGAYLKYLLDADVKNHKLYDVFTELAKNCQTLDVVLPKDNPHYHMLITLVVDNDISSSELIKLAELCPVIYKIVSVNAINILYEQTQ